MIIKPIINSRLPIYIGMCVSLFQLSSSAAWAESGSFNLNLDDVMPDWNISGYNTYRVDSFEDSGDISNSPYPNRGFQQFDDFNFNLSRRYSAYENVKVQLSGTVDDSEYRTSEEGFILERGYLTWEKGDSQIPFRMEMGDFFGNQTLRTLQRSLKGVQLELQPNLFNNPQSIQLFGGVTNNTYRGFSDNKDFFTGASWLVPETKLGIFALTAVNNTTEATISTPRLNQTVYSMAWGKEANYLKQKIELEAEYAFLSGDVSTTEFNKHDNGFYTQLKGKSENKPLTYRLRHERYGDDFRPNGSSITSNQRATEMHLGWRFSNGISARGRLQTFRTNWKTSNPTDRDVAGITFSGPLIQSIQLSGTLGSFISDNETADNTTRSFTHSTNASFSMPVADHWVARLGGVITEVDNRVTGNATVSRQISLGVDHDFEISGFRGSVSPSLNLRDNIEAGNTTQSDISPALSFYLNKGSHNLAFSYNTQFLDSKSLTGTDTETYQTSLNYSYTKNAHRIQLEANHFDRNPTPGSGTDAYRVGVSWTYNFDRPARVIPAVQTQQQYDLAVQDSAASSVPVAFETQADIRDLTPDMPMDEVHARLAHSGIVEPLVRTGLEVYETQMLETIDHRQRLALVTSNNFLDKAVLAIEFDDLGDIDSTAQIYDEVRKILFDKYGPPINRIEEGDFSDNLRNDLRTGLFKRIIEWRTSKGVMRFGIPHRTDGQIRMEIIHARDFSSGENNFWSIEQLR
jgi:hypothetical protein